MNTKTKRAASWIFVLLSASYFAVTIWHQQANEKLQAATLSGSVPQVEKALRHGASVNVCDPDGYTPLMYAAERGHVAVARILLAHGASVNAADYAHSTVLSLAAGNGNEEVVTLLLAHGADVTDENARQAFAYASEYPLITVLLKQAQSRQHAQTNKP